MSPPEVNRNGPSVFVSYSREDGWLVKPIVDVIRATGSLVFRDEDSIAPGKRWRLEVTSAIAGCDAMLVFWCEHASESTEVKSEYIHALCLDKVCIPILLDATPLNSELEVYQAIDMRALALSGHPRVKALDLLQSIRGRRADYVPPGESLPATPPLPSEEEAEQALTLVRATYVVEKLHERLVQ